MRGDVPERASGGGLAAAPGPGVLAYAGFAPGIADRRFAEPATTGHRECAGYAFALTYGPGTDWVKNVLAAGSCELRAAHARAHRPAGLPACAPRREPARHPPLRTPGTASPRRRRLPDPQDGTRSSHKSRPGSGVTAEINHVLRRQPVTRHYECVSAIRITLCDEPFRSRTLAEPPLCVPASARW